MVSWALQVNVNSIFIACITCVFFLAYESVFLSKPQGINVLSGMTGLCLAEGRTPAQAANLLDSVLAVRLTSIALD